MVPRINHRFPNLTIYILILWTGGLQPTQMSRGWISSFRPKIFQIFGISKKYGLVIPHQKWVLCRNFESFKYCVGGNVDENARSTHAMFWRPEISAECLFLMLDHMVDFFCDSKTWKFQGIKFKIHQNVRRWVYVTIRCNKIRSGLIKKSFNKSSNYLLILHLYSFKT